MDDRINILLIEDEDPHAELIQRAFEDQNSHVHICRVKSLTEAREQIRTQEPTLIIADWRLPDGESMELLPDHRSPVYSHHSHDKLWQRTHCSGSAQIWRA